MKKCIGTKKGIALQKKTGYNGGQKGEGMKKEVLKRTSVQIAPSELAAMARLAKKYKRTRSAQIRLAVMEAAKKAGSNGEL